MALALDHIGDNDPFGDQSYLLHEKWPTLMKTLGTSEFDNCISDSTTSEAKKIKQLFQFNGLVQGLDKCMQFTSLAQLPKSLQKAS